MFCVSPGDLSFLFHIPVFLYYWLIEAGHKFIVHSQKGDDEIGNPEHLLFTKSDMLLKTRNLLRVLVQFLLN
jgi:hypothetical protein